MYPDEYIEELKDNADSDDMEWNEVEDELGSLISDMKEVCGVKNPRVAVANVGLEEEKGNSLVKAAYSQLKTNKRVNFIGSIEARAIPYGKADVIVADGFVGNVIISWEIFL